MLREGRQGFSMAANCSDVDSVVAKVTRPRKTCLVAAFSVAVAASYT